MHIFTAHNLSLLCDFVLHCLNICVISPLPAERHAGCSCITASVDDIHFEHTIGWGINLNAALPRCSSNWVAETEHIACIAYGGENKKGRSDKKWWLVVNFHQSWKRNATKKFVFCYKTLATILAKPSKSMKSLACLSSYRQKKVEIDEQTDINWRLGLTVETLRLCWYYNHCHMLIVKRSICICLLQGG